MSQENVELVRSGLRSAAIDAISTPLSQLTDPEVEFTTRLHGDGGRRLLPRP